jgi:capsular exopolysaccharide synthesis family protein
MFDSSRNGAVVSADAVRLCGTLRAALAEGDRVVLMSSAYPGEGVSAITAQVGQALAMMSREPVLLVDANLRHSSLHDLLHVRQEPGLVDFLRGAAPFDEVVHPTSIVRLSVLPAGRSGASGMEEVVQSERYAELLELARKRFRYVMLDCAAMLRYADGVVIAHHVDAAVIVVSQRERRKSDVAELTRLLHGLNTKVLGAILSRS